MPRVPFRSYSFHGGAGAILSVGLLNAVNYTELEMCVHATKAPGQPLPAALRPLAALRRHLQEVAAGKAGLSLLGTRCAVPGAALHPALTQRPTRASCCRWLSQGLSVRALAQHPLLASCYLVLVQGLSVRVPTQHSLLPSS